MSKWCKACSIVKQENFSTQQWGSASETQTITSDLQANPSINTVIVTFDGMSDGIESAVSSAAATHPGSRCTPGAVVSPRSRPSRTVAPSPVTPVRTRSGTPTTSSTRRSGCWLAQAGGERQQGDRAEHVLHEEERCNVLRRRQGQAYSDKPYSDGAFVQDYLRCGKSSSSSLSYGRRLGRYNYTQ